MPDGKAITRLVGGAQLGLRVPCSSCASLPGALPAGFPEPVCCCRLPRGRIQESEVTGAGWYPLAAAERFVGQRIGRAVSVPPDRLTGLRMDLWPTESRPSPDAPDPALVRLVRSVRR
jgi:hypothetical protein